MSDEVVEKERSCCSGCNNVLKYGAIAVVPNNTNDFLCTKCAQKRRVTGEARILGGDSPSSVDRERAQKSLKWLQRR